MKSIHWYSIILLFFICLMGCKKMDSTYKQYIVPGGLPYTGKATNAKAYAGKNRIKVAWPKSKDPNVIKAKIFWNNYADSLEVNTQSYEDTVSVIIDNLPEKPYTFNILTYDEKGIPSIPVELLSGSYGEKYQAQLLNRPVNSLFIDVDGKITIDWGNADISSGAVFSELKYINPSGDAITKRFSVKEAKSFLTDLKSGTRFEYRTEFRPDTLYSIDSFFTGYAESQELTISKASWKIIAFSSEHDAGVNGVKNFIDGTDGTRWHSKADGTTKYPHFATIDMGVERTITQFGVWRTTFENGGDNRAPNKIQFFTSIDNVTWADQGVFDFNRLINGEQTILLPLKPRARYFKFVAVSGPENNMVMGEISAYGL